MQFGKRVDGHSGRRTESRAEVMYPASATTLSWSKAVLVVDLSTTGARLEGASFPPCGANLLLKIGEIDVLATVLWRGEDQCGVRLDEAISLDLIQQLQRQTGSPLTSNLTADERIAIAHWAEVATTAH